MAYVLSSVSGNLISAASAGFAPTNSADVSAIASAYQVVSATATQLYAGTAYVTSVNDNPLSASRAGNAANASLATSAYYDGTGRLISSLPDSATVSAIASSYAESAASSKQDTLTFGYDADDKISSINGSSLAGEGGGMITSIESSLDPWYQTAISGLNGSSIYPKWSESAQSASHSNTADYAYNAGSAAAAPTSWASSFISSVSSPSGTIRVLNGNEIEGTNSAVLPSTVVEGFSVVSSIPDSLTAFSFTVPTSNPNTQVIITGGWANGNFGISGDNGITAESSLAGPVNVTFDMPGATAFDVTSEAWVNSIGYTASALASEVGGGIGELAWASALPTYQYNAEDKISGINGSAIAGGSGGGIDSATCSAIASAYAESAVSSYQPLSGMSGYASAFSAGEGLEFVQSGSDQVLQVEAPVDIVAGPGIVIDNPDGNTLRVSMAADYEVTLFENASGTTTNIVCSEKMSNFDRVRFYLYPAENTIASEYTEEFAGSSTIFSLTKLKYSDYANIPFVVYGTYYSTTDSKTITFGSTEHIWFGPSWNVLGTGNTSPINVVKIVGVNRIAND